MTKEELQQAHYIADIEEMTYASIFSKIVVLRDTTGTADISQEEYEQAKQEWITALDKKIKSRQAVINFDFGIAPETKPEKGVVYNFVARKIIEGS